MPKTRRTIAALGVLLLAIYGYFVYATVRVATAVHLGGGEVAAIAVLSIALLGLLGGVALVALRSARDRIAEMIERERGGHVELIQANLWPDAADVVSRVVETPDRLAEFDQNATAILAEFRQAFDRRGKHRAPDVDETAPLDPTELGDDTNPNLFTHPQLFGFGA